MGNEKTTKAKKIVGIVANVLVWIFLAFSMIITILVFTAQGSEDGVPSIFGRSLITIETESMEPTYKVGDLVLMKKIADEDKASLAKDTIITYRAPIDINGDGKIGDINTHRIVSNDAATGVVVTQGDNNLITDAEGDTAYTIHHNDIIGVCTENGKLGGMGNVIGFLRSSLGFFLCIVLPLILFFLYELYNFITILVTEKAKRTAGAAKASEEEIKQRAIEEYLKSHGLSADGTPAEEKKADDAEVEANDSESKND